MDEIKRIIEEFYMGDNRASEYEEKQSNQKFENKMRFLLKKINFENLNKLKSILIFNQGGEL